MATTQPAKLALSGQAQELHSQAIVINGLDGTVLPRHLPDFPLGDYFPLLVRGGVTAFVTTVAKHHADDFTTALERFTSWHRLLTRDAEHYLLARKAEDVVRAKREDKVAVILTLQDALPYGEVPERAVQFQEQGLRIQQLTYQGRNQIGSGCGEAVDGGLTVLGRKLVRVLNEQRIVVDVAHVGERTALDAIAASSQPVIASHTGAAATFAHPRNVSDVLLKAIGESGGVAGVYAISQFLLPDGVRKKAALDDVLRHISYIASLIGSDRVGLGLDVGTFIQPGERDQRAAAWTALAGEFPELLVADFDFDTAYAAGLEDPSGIPQLTEGLLRVGFSASEVLGILGGNFLRVFEQVWG